MSKEMTLQEKKEKVKNLRPIDDVFFEVLAEKREVCEEILRTILEDPKLVVNEVVTQSSARNIYGRSVRLDALCTLGNGTKCNIEVQRSDNDNHLKRARFNAANITVKESNPGDTFEDVMDVYIVYISEFDFLDKCKTIYHIDKTIRETGDVVDDGLHEIFVNTAIDDGTDIADLMSCFTKKEVKNPKFPKLSNEVQRLKETEGGLSAVCEVMEKYNKEAVKENNYSIIAEMLRDGTSREFIKKYFDVSDDELKDIEASLLRSI